MLTRLALLLLLAGLLVAAPALAATKNGITPLRPKARATVPSGKAVTFTMRVKGKGSVFVHVCKSARKNSKGVICDDEFIGQAKKRGGIFRVTQKFFDFDSFWLNNPGTYYWQAHRIDCSVSLKDCLREGPVVKFRVG